MAFSIAMLNYQRVAISVLRTPRTLLGKNG
jgi:hypothetical protein